MSWKVIVQVMPKKKKQTEQVYWWTGTNVDMQRSRNVDGVYLAVNVILSMEMNR